MKIWIGSLLIKLTVQIHIFHALFATKGIGGEIQEWNTVHTYRNVWPNGSDEDILRLNNGRFWN